MSLSGSKHILPAKRFASHFLLTTLTIVYPFAVLFLHDFAPARASLILPFAVLVMRLLIGRNWRQDYLLQASFAALILAAITSILAPELATKAYPVFVSAALASIFALSLVYPPPIVERLARLSEPDLPPAAVRYVRQVTIMWLAFFLCNGALSAASAIWGSLTLWTFYNGFISYILIAALLGGEYLARRRVMRRR